MKWYLKVFYKNKPRLKKKYSLKLIKVSKGFRTFRWEYGSFYIKKVNEPCSLAVLKQLTPSKFNWSKQELFSFRKLIGNFCFDGRYLKYFIIFKRVVSELYFHFYAKSTLDKLTLSRWNNLSFFLKNVKTNLLLTLTNHFIYYLFSKNEILFFAKAVKLRKRVAKKLKKKYRLAFEYVPPNKRLLRTMKFWKYYINYSSKDVLDKRLLNGLFRLVIDPKTSILTKYRQKVIRMLIKKKKLNL